jgi:uncharacterized repeat protein (TIGR01451 family)
MKRSVRQRPVVLTLVASALVLLVASGSQAAPRAFASRFSDNMKGNFVFVGNTILTCQDAVVECPGARDATGGTLNNNDFDMRLVDVDSDGATFDSSQADLTLAAGSTIEFAGLYWGADTSAGTNGVAAPDASKFDTVLFTPPGGSQTTVTATPPIDSSGTRYQAFADVTSLVSAGGNGTYTVADIQAGTGQDRYGGWSLVVVYSNSTELTRNVTVFDGFQVVNSGNPVVTIPVSGFLTPTSGSVDTALGVVAYEGDRGFTGDSLQLGPTLATLTTMTDAQNPADNFFNSTISRLGTLITAKSPNYVNQLGFDADVVDASGVLPNGSNAAVMRLTTGGETYFPGVVVFATQLFAPDLLTTIAKSVTDVNGGAVLPGDTLEYTVSFSNVGTDSATNVVLDDPIPAGTTYVPGSLQVVTGANTGTMTDASGDDQAEFGSGHVVFRLGTGATSSSGGVIAPTEATSIRFQVTVDASTPDGTVVSNAAQLAYNALTLGTAYNGPSPTASVTVTDRADLSVTKTASPASYSPNKPLTYTITVTNGGPAAVAGASVSDTVPTPVLGFNWTCPSGCSPSSGTGNVSTSVSLASGASAVITLTGTIPNGTTGTLTNTVTVAAPSGVTDPNPGNNSATQTTSRAGSPPPPPPPPPSSSPSPTSPSADVSITKTGPSSANLGDTVSFTLAAHNNGPNAAASVVVRDTLPGELEYVSATASGGVACSASGQAVQCTIATLSASSTVSITVQAKVVGGAGGSVANVGTVSATTADPDSANNSSSVAVAIGSPPPPAPTPKPKPPVTRRSPKLFLNKRWLAPDVRAGETARVQITIRNSGRATAENVQVCDDGGKQLSFVAAPDAYYRNGSACWRVVELAPGKSRTFIAVVRVDRTAKGKSIVNVATATASNSGAVAPARASIRLKPARGKGRPGGVTG